jgi:DNA-binding NtrC family response regulator
MFRCQRQVNTRKMMKTLSAILVVSDATLRKNLSNALMKNGIDQCTFCTHGCQALEQVEKRPFQILYADLTLGDMSGVDLVRRLKKRHPSIYALVGACRGTADDVVSALASGAADFIIDPFASELVENAFARAARALLDDQGPDASASRQSKTVVTQDKALLSVLEIARKVATSSATVLITGESGTGKEMLAAYIHANSSRKRGPYIAINCAALPEQLAESELFGHEKGAFTGAIAKKIGKFESAAKGTLVLDEITEMALPLQAKLLRALQEREIVRLGANHPIPIDSRVIAISNQNMKTAVKKGTFREDLYYRLNVIPLTIPPLRERKNDIPLLADYFFKRFSAQNATEMTCISDQAMDLLIQQPWPGNVRELENIIERGVLVGCGEALLPAHLILEEALIEPARKPALTAGMTVREVEKELIFNTLNAVNDNRTHAAKMLGISIRTLRNKLNEYREETEAAAG